MDSSTGTIIVVSIFAIIVIFSFMIYQQHGEAEIKIFGISLKTKGSNEKSQPKPAISAKDIVSREGGLLADDATGQGIEVEKVNVKDDVLLSSNNSSQKVNKMQSTTEQSDHATLTAQMMSAGGNITIQQFVGGQTSLPQELDFFIKQIGLENIRENNFTKSQFEAYSEVWKSLQGLRIAGDDLWEKASHENVIAFAERLRETSKFVYEGEIFFDDKDRDNLLEVLRCFGQYRIGKMELIDIRTKRELEESIESEKEFESVVTEKIKRNYKNKTLYEQLLEKIRVSFKKRLSN